MSRPDSAVRTLHVGFWPHRAVCRRALITSVVARQDCLLLLQLGNSQSRSLQTDARSLPLRPRVKRLACLLQSQTPTAGYALQSLPATLPAGLGASRSWPPSRGAGRGRRDPSISTGRSPLRESPPHRAKTLALRHCAPGSACPAWNLLHPRLPGLSLRVLQPIDVAVLTDLAQIAHVRRSDLAAPPPAADKAKAEQVAITPAFEAVVGDSDSDCVRQPHLM